MKRDEFINLDKLIAFQQSEDPSLIYKDLNENKEWTCAQNKVLSNRKISYRWRRNGSLNGAPFLAFSIDEILFMPIENHSSVIFYFTPNKKTYNLIIEEAKKNMVTSSEKTVNGELAFDFTDSNVAIQAGFAKDHFTILIMSRLDYDKGLRFN